MFKFFLLLPLVVLSYCLPVMAKPTLTVYTTSSFASKWGPAPKIKQAYEAICDCNLNFVGIDNSATILTRLKMEGSNSKADIILGLDQNLLTEAKQTHLFVPHQIKTNALSIDWHDDFFIPFDYGYLAFIYNKEKISSPPSSLQALFKNQEWSVIYPDPRTSTVGLNLVLWVEKIYGDDSKQAWELLAPHTLSVTKSWGEAYNLFLKGEADFVLSYTTSPAYHILNEQDNRYQAAIFDEGQYMQIEIAGQLRNSKNADLAHHFMQFILSPEFQQHIPTNNWMYPVIDLPLPEAFIHLPKLKKSFPLPAEEVAANKKEWIQLWQQVP